MADENLLGVGFLGAGPVTQAIHLPALARLADTYRVVTVMDVDTELAEAVARRVGARATTSVDSLLSDPLVDVVAICSPHRFHAEQVIAACRAGKKAVLCEKPFAMTGEEASAITAVSKETGVPVMVGAMHVYDPGWTAAQTHWADVSAHTIRSSIVLPPNARFEDFATEVVHREPPSDDSQFDDLATAAAVVHGAVLGLAIHDLPLIRRLLPTFRYVEVLFAEALRPYGYLIVLRCGDTTVELHAVISENWSPSWVLQFFSDGQATAVEFSPSYVHAGSAVCRISRPGSNNEYGPFQYNGYEGEWRQLAEMARGAEPSVSTADLIDDLTFAVAIADMAATHIRNGSGQVVPG